MVGPGVQDAGVDSSTWTDHTNVRPTMLALLGLRDDYLNDGRVLVEGLDTKATPHALVAHRETVRRLGDAYEQLNAAFGDFALETLQASTAAIASSDESTYNRIEDAITSLTQRRDALAGDIKSQLAAAAFDAQDLDESQAKSEIDQAQELIDQARTLAS
jgi:hypothetical protein